MLATLINKELRSIILGPKFTGAFIVCAVLILVSVFTGLREYRESVARYDAASRLVTRELEGKTSWGLLRTKAYRAPDPMQILVSGLEYDIGRWSAVSNNSSAKLKNSAYSDETIYAIFRVVDFSFIVRFVLSLFAILFTYNAVSGEREDGTLRLVFSNAVSRAQYLCAKCAGSWLGLVVPISIPVMLGLMVVLLSGVPLSSEHWIKIAILMLLSLIFFTLFIVLGVLISSLTRYSSVSFLLSLVVWIFFVLIIPRGGIMAAGSLVAVPRVAEMDGQISGYSKDRREEFYQDFDRRWEKHRKDLGVEAGELTDELMWSIMEMEDSLRKEMENEINQFDLKLHEDLRQRKNQQEKLAFALSRFSPSAAYQLAVISLAGNDIQLKSRYEEAINAYRDQFYEYVNKKQTETGDTGRRMFAISISDSNSSFKFGGGRDQKHLDLSGLPRFEPPTMTLADAVSPVITDVGLLLVYIIVTSAGAYIAFLRYDAR